MNNNSLKPFIKFMAIVLGGLFLIMFIYEVNSEQKRSCAAPGCKDQPIYSDYCYQHRVNDENYEVESDSQESETTALEEATTDSYYEVDSNSSNSSYDNSSSDDSNSYSGSYSNSSSSSGTYSNSTSSSSNCSHVIFVLDNRSTSSALALNFSNLDNFLPVIISFLALSIA